MSVGAVGPVIPPKENGRLVPVRPAPDRRTPQRRLAARGREQGLERARRRRASWVSSSTSSTSRSSSRVDRRGSCPPRSRGCARSRAPRSRPDHSAGGGSPGSAGLWTTRIARAGRPRRTASRSAARTRRRCRRRARRLRASQRSRMSLALRSSASSPRRRAGPDAGVAPAPMWRPRACRSRSAACSPRRPTSGRRSSPPPRPPARSCGASRNGAQGERLVALAQARERVAVALADPPPVPGGGRGAVGLGDPESQPTPLERRRGEGWWNRLAPRRPRRSRRGPSSAHRGVGRTSRGPRRAARRRSSSGRRARALRRACDGGGRAGCGSCGCGRPSSSQSRPRRSRCRAGRPSCGTGGATGLDAPQTTTRAARRSRSRSGRGAAERHAARSPFSSSAHATAISASSSPLQAGVNQSPRRAPAKRSVRHRPSRDRDQRQHATQPSSRCQRTTNGSSSGWVASHDVHHSGVREGFSRSSASARQRPSDCRRERPVRRRHRRRHSSSLDRHPAHAAAVAQIEKRPDRHRDHCPAARRRLADPVPHPGSRQQRVANAVGIGSQPGHSPHRPRHRSELGPVDQVSLGEAQAKLGHPVGESPREILLIAPYLIDETRRPARRDPIPDSTQASHAIPDPRKGWASRMSRRYIPTVSPRTRCRALISKVFESNMPSGKRSPTRRPPGSGAQPLDVCKLPSPVLRYVVPALHHPLYLGLGHVPIIGVRHRTELAAGKFDTPIDGGVFALIRLPGVADRKR